MSNSRRSPATFTKALLDTLLASNAPEPITLDAQLILSRLPLVDPTAPATPMVVPDGTPDTQGIPGLGELSIPGLDTTLDTPELKLGGDTPGNDGM